MENKVPQIRFAGFEGDWEQYSFTDLAKKRKFINNGLKETNLLSLSYGKIKRKDITSSKGLLPTSYATYQIIEPDTVVFRFTDLQNDQKSLRVGLSKETGIVSSAYVCVDPNKNKLNSDFFYWLLHFKDTNKVFYKMGDGIRQTISYEDLREMDICIPPVDEQEIVALTLDAIDSQICQQEIRCEKLRNLKSSMLSALFPVNGERQPRLRLDGFSGDWNSHSFSDFTYRIKRKNAGLESDNVMTISALHGLISQTEFFNKRIASTDLSGYYLMHNGEFAYNKSYSADYPWGAVKRLDRYAMGVVSNLYIIFGIKDIDSDFLVCYFMTNLWHRQVALCAKEGARNHGLLNISAEDFLNISIMIPPSKEEQQAIANLLMEYDRLIQLNEQKLEKLRNVKQAMLDKMFV